MQQSRDIQVYEGKISGRLGNPVVFRLVGGLFRAGRGASPGSVTVRLVDVGDDVRAEINAHYGSGFSLIGFPQLANAFQEQFDELIAVLEK